MAPEAVLCVDCGYHTGHGRVVRSHESSPAESSDPDRKWLYAAGGTAAFGVVLVGLLIWWTSGPPSIVGTWTGRAVIKVGDKVGYTDPVSLTFRKDGTVSCSDGTAGDYSIQGDTLRVRLEKHDGANVSIGFESKFSLDSHMLTIDKYPFAPDPMHFYRE
jgi:hypothetical protein